MLRYLDELQITKNTGYYNEFGEWVNSADTPITIKCNIQPMRQRKDRENLPEGKRTRQSWVVRIPIKEIDDLDISDPLTDQAGDTTIIDGFSCEAVFREKWRHRRLAHYKVLFTRNEVEGNSI